MCVGVLNFNLVEMRALILHGSSRMISTSGQVTSVMWRKATIMPQPRLFHSQWTWRSFIRASSWLSILHLNRRFHDPCRPTVLGRLGSGRSQ